MTEPRRESRREQVQRLTAEYERDPVAFRRSVLSLMRRGYAYIYGILALIVGLFLFVFIASVIVIPFWSTPINKPPIKLIKTIMIPATASPRTNLLAPSIAPKKVDSLFRS